MGFKCAIVGLPNVGKSTLFNALTKAGIAAQNYPFCTIEPNIGIVNVPDKRLKALEKIAKPERVLSAVMQFVDIAGLVKGASKGEGLGNQFLANIRETDTILHVTRCFDNSDVIHVSGNVNPLHDIEIINTELALADMSTVDKALQKAQKNSKTGNKESIGEKNILEKIKKHLDDGLPVRTLELTPKESLFTRKLCLITAKPVLYIANVDEDGFENNSLLNSVKELADKQNAKIVAICAATEAELMQMSEDDRKAFMEDLGLEESGLDRVIRAGYDLLGLETYFTAGVKEVRAWTIEKGMLAPQAASVIHTDFEKGFIRAEVITFENFVKYHGEQGAKEAGKMRLEGKEYVVKDGDVIHFRVNTP